MEQSPRMTERAEDTLRAERFTRSFDTSFAGGLARLLGVERAEQFTPPEGSTP